MILGPLLLSGTAHHLMPTRWTKNQQLGELMAGQQEERHGSCFA
jgi:hypothetical protein